MVERDHANERHHQGHAPTSRMNDLQATLTLKEGPLFLVADQSGEIPAQAGEEATNSRGLGLYFHDMRHLDQVTLRLNDVALIPLLASADLGYQSVCELTNPAIPLQDGTMLPEGRFGLRWERVLSERLDERLTFRNFGTAALDVTLTLTYDAHFASMFAVRGSAPGKRGTLHRPEAHRDTLLFAYDGADDHRRTTTIQFVPPPAAIEGQCATYNLRLAPGVSCDYTVILSVADHPPGETRLETHPQPSPVDKNAVLHHAEQGSFNGTVRVETSSMLLNRVLRRSFLDLSMLAMNQGGDEFYAAGVPWYVALFGRDSLITALEMLAYAPAIARSTIETLTRYQGTKDDAFQEEEPGKIPHELRVGEQANLREVPSIPYYGTIDATPLFLILLGEYLHWTGDLDFFHRLRPQVDAALAWIERRSRTDGDGFLTYDSTSAQGLANQGWKDSGNSIVNADGRIVTPLWRWSRSRRMHTGRSKA